MTETRTPRFQLAQWSSGSDSPGRGDFNESFLSIEENAAHDAGVTVNALPTTGLFEAQYVLFGEEDAGTPTGRRTLYRRSDTSSWDVVGGNTLPDSVTIRPYDGVGGGGPVASTAGLTLAHPDAAQPGAALSFDGSARFGGTLRSYDLNAAAAGSVIIGTTATADPATLGRLHVRTRATGDRGMVIRPHDPAAGNSLTVQNSGGSDLFSLDSTARMRQTTFAGFGGAALPSTSMLAAAPSSNPDDGVVNGLLLYGHDSGNPAVTSKTMLRILPDNTVDTTPIMTVARTAISIGRLPWGSSTTGGTVTVAGRQMTFRGLGYTADQAVAAFKLAASGSPENPANDVNLLVVNREALSMSVSGYLSNHRSQSTPSATFYRYGSTAPVAQFAQATVDGGGGTTYSLISEWAGDGRLKAGALWKGTAVLRDARQSLKHTSVKKWAVTGDPPTAGQTINPNSSFTYTWGAMTPRSSGSLDLVISTIAEIMLIATGPGGEDGQPVNIETQININGGGWFDVGDSENAPVAVGTDTGHRQGGDVFESRHRIINMTGDVPFQVRTTVTAGSSLVSLRLRMLDLLIEECCIQAYTAP